MLVVFYEWHNAQPFSAEFGSVFLFASSLGFAFFTLSYVLIGGFVKIKKSYLSFPFYFMNLVFLSGGCVV